MTTFDDFIPASEVKIDPKNRLPVGATMKKVDGSSPDLMMLTISFDGCLIFMYPDGWDSVMAKLLAKGETDKNALTFERTMRFYAQKVKPDSQWRVVVPPRLMELAGFDDERRDACLFWVRNRLEVWEKSNFDAYMRNKPYELHEVVQALKEASGDLSL